MSQPKHGRRETACRRRSERPSSTRGRTCADGTLMGGSSTLDVTSGTTEVRHMPLTFSSAARYFDAAVLVGYRKKISHAPTTRVDNTLTALLGRDFVPTPS